MLLTVAPIIFIVMSIYKPFAILNNIQNFYPTTESRVKLYEKIKMLCNFL